MKNIKDVSINELTLDELKIKLEKQPYMIKYLKHQKSELCKVAILSNPRVLCLIRDQSEDLCMLAIEMDYITLAYVRNLTDKIVRFAIQCNEYAKYYLPQEWYDKVIMD